MTSYLPKRVSLLVRRLKAHRRKGFKGLNSYFLRSHGIHLYKDTESFLLGGGHFSQMARYLPFAKQVYAEVVKNRSGMVTRTKMDAGEELCIFLYSYIRQFKPKTIVETGVANGITTNVILAALKENARLANIGSDCCDTSVGGLISFDVDARCGGVYQGNQSWTFYQLKGNLRKELVSRVSVIPSVDLWLHDSDHSIKWMDFEYALALTKLKQTKGLKLLISDDIDSNDSFGRLSLGRKDDKFAIFDTAKFFGGVII